MTAKHEMTLQIRKMDLFHSQKKQDVEEPFLLQPKAAEDRLCYPCLRVGPGFPGGEGCAEGSGRTPVFPPGFLPWPSAARRIVFYSEEPFWPRSADSQPAPPA